MTKTPDENRFICDRMMGTVCRYLRLLGYDTLDANDLPKGNRREDTDLLNIAREQNRIILTRDAELSRRDPQFVRYLKSDTFDDQIRQLVSADLIFPNLRLSRCSLCNSLLLPITEMTLKTLSGKIQDRIPDEFPEENTILWCNQCKKAYWEGSHTRNMRARTAGFATMVPKCKHPGKSETV
jgi:uncharacterized protein with PIN domain